ncbi:MAG: retron system putative HNH endonuclease [Planctomycetia bacterium]|nr:retron system putative HNH endonuclease [Planctomycetia bacterium]
MKHIQKDTPPASFVQCLKEKPKMNWDDFCRPAYIGVKQDLGNSLRREQGYLCCYCEQEIVKGISHIEHFRPKSLFPQFSLTYTNLLASCNGCGKKEDTSCGVKKRDIFFEEIVSPTDEKCEKRFIYTMDGQILPRDENDEYAWQTIAILGLNVPKLRRRREMVFQEMEVLQELLPAEEFRKYIEIRLQKTPHGRFCEFWTTVKYASDFKD